MPQSEFFIFLGTICKASLSMNIMKDSIFQTLSMWGNEDYDMQTVSTGAYTVMFNFTDILTSCTFHELWELVLL